MAFKCYLISTAIISLLVSDIKCESCGLPLFLDNISIKEDIPKDTIIATTYKIPENAVFSFDDSQSTEYINPIRDKDGFLKYKVIKSVHEVPDGGDGTEGSSTLIIQIESINDHDPIFNFPSFSASVLQKYLWRMSDVLKGVFRQDESIKNNFQIAVHNSLIIITSWVNDTIRFHQRIPLQIMPPGFILQTDNAIVVTDEDSIESQDSIVKVSILSGDSDGAFEVEQKNYVPNNTWKSRIVHVSVKLKSDKIRTLQKEKYDLVLLATDQIPEKPVKKQVTLTVHVTPLDLRDPRFEELNYEGDLHFDDKTGEITVREDDNSPQITISNNQKLTLEKLKPKTKIIALDQDKLIDEPLEYKLLPSNGKDWTAYFKYDSTQNMLSLIKVDDAIYAQTSISFLIQASQKIDTERFAITMVTLRIHLPQKKEIYFSQKVELLRRSEKGKLIYKLDIVDGRPDDVVTMISDDEEYLELKDRQILLKKILPDDVKTLTSEIDVKTKGTLAPSSSKVKVQFDVVTVKTIQHPLFEKKKYNLDIWQDMELNKPFFKLMPMETGITYKIDHKPDSDTIKFNENSGELILLKKPTESVYTLSIEGIKGESTDKTEIEIKVIKPKDKPLSLFKTQKQVVQIYSDYQKNKVVLKMETNFDGIVMTYSDNPSTPANAKVIFGLNPSGEISLIGDLEKVVTEYILFVHGSLNADGIVREEVNEVSIKVVKKIDPPKSLFKKSVYSFDLMSDTAINEEIFQIKTELPNVKLEIKDSIPVDGQTIFSLNEDNGKLKLTNSLVENVEIYTLVILGKVDSREEQVNVVVNVVKKANPPSSLFKKSIFSFDLMSDTAIDEEIFTIETEMPDVKMEIKDGNPIFDLNRDNGKLKLVKSLVENIDKYTLVILGKVDSREEQVDVVVNVVKKATAPSPLFKKSIYRFDLLSDTVKDHEISQIDSLDGVKMTLKSVEPPTPQGIFTLSEKGKLTLSGTLPKEPNLFKLLVHGSLSGREEEVEVVIYVVQKLKPPRPIFKKQRHHLDLKIDTQKDKEIFKVETNDNGVKMKIKSVIPQSSTSLFKINDDSGQITLTASLDGGIIEYKLTVVGNIQSQEDITEVIFDVVSEDSENCGLLDLPKLAHLKKLPNNLNVGDPIFKITATKEATFKATGGDTEYFNVNGADGVITLAKKLETVYYNLDVLVTSTSTQTPEKTATAQVIQLLFEVDIKKPLTTLFKKDINHVDVPVDTPTSVGFYQLELMEPSRVVSLSITGGKDKEHFEVKNDGLVSLKKILQVDGIYEMEVTAGDSSPIALMDKTLVKFYGVEVKRELTAIFTKSQYEVNIIECTKIGTVVYLLETIVNGATFALKGEDKYFDLDTKTGELKVKGKLEKGKQYALDIEAVEGSTKDKTKVIFQVLESEKCLLFTRRIESVDISPLTKPGTSVFTLEANRPVSFKIEDGNTSVFNINENTGEFTTVAFLEGEMEYIYLVKVTSLEAPVVTDSIKVRFHVNNCTSGGVVGNQNCTSVGGDQFHFTKPVYSVNLKPDMNVGSDLQLEALQPKGTSFKYFLSDTNSFELSYDGKLSLKAKPDELQQQLYFLVASSVPIQTMYEQTKSEDFIIPDVEQNQAMIIVKKTNQLQAPVFLHESPLIKVLLPTASLSEYVINIKAIADKGEIEYSLTDEHFMIGKKSGQIFPKVDVTITVEGHFKLTVIAVSTANIDLKAQLSVEIIRLKQQEIIVINSANTENLQIVDIQQKLEDATKLKIILLSYYENPSYFYATYNSIKTFAVAAFETGTTTPITTEKFKSLTKPEEIQNEIGQHEFSEFKNENRVQYILKEKEVENGGLVAGVAILSVLLALFVLTVVAIVALRKYKPHLLAKIESKFGIDKRPIGNERKTSNSGGFEKNNSYENYGLDIDSVRSSSYASISQTELTNDLSKPMLKPEPAKIEETKLTTNIQAAPIYVNWSSAAMTEPTPPEATSTPIEKETEKDHKTDALLQVPVDHHQQDKPDEVEPDYPTETDSTRPKRLFHQQDSFGQDIDEPSPSVQEAPEAFNNDLIDEEDVDTGEPGGTPHVHRKHVEIHVEEDISDGEEEMMMQKMAAIPQRKSVVTFSDKTEVIP